MKKTMTIIAATGLLASVGGCAFGPDKSREDAKDVTTVTKSPPEVITFNNHYPNVENKCDGHGHRVFVNTQKAMTIYPDPTCPGFVRGQEPNIIVGSTAPASK